MRTEQELRIRLSFLEDIAKTMSDEDDDAIATITEISAIRWALGEELGNCVLLGNPRDQSSEEVNSGKQSTFLKYN